MNRKFKRVIAMVLTCGLLFTTGAEVFATTKEEAQQKIEQLKKEQSALKQRLSALQAEKADTEAYIKELDTEMQQVIEDIREVTLRLEELEAEIAETEKNLAAAEQRAADQYTALKLRIKQMYEEGDPSLMEIILQAEDISTILNSSEYISKISDYDNDLLAALNETIRQIEEYKALLEEQKAEQEQIKAELEIKQADLQTIIDQKNEELKALGIDISDAYHSISETENALKETQSILAAIKEAERKAAEALAQQQQQQSGSSSSGTTSGTTSGGAVASSTKLSWPCAGGYMSSGYGPRTAPTAGASSYHRGIDIAASAGTGIKAAQTGTVVTASYSSIRGYYVVISHGNGMSTLYQHCSALYVSPGQSVSQGATIAAVGSTGVSTGAHLHFEVLINGSNVNPSNYL